MLSGLHMQYQNKLRFQTLNCGGFTVTLGKKTAKSGIDCPVLGSLVQDRDQQTGESRVEDNCHGKGEEL